MTVAPVLQLAWACEATEPKSATSPFVPSRSKICVSPRRTGLFFFDPVKESDADDAPSAACSGGTSDARRWVSGAAVLLNVCFLGNACAALSL